ncbi:MAG TPA: low molecular weight protein-tyrosine-phosphatase [Burkholderiales bacterium]
MSGASDRPVRVLFVCTGNICRSPTAEGIFLKLVHDAGLDQEIRVDSAGTHGYHVGEPPDLRTCEAAAHRGYDLSALRARKFERADFHSFDLVLAMDRENHSHLVRLVPPSEGHKLKMMMEYSRRFSGREVPDPYYGGSRGFEVVLDMLEDASRGLLEAIVEKQRAPGP